MRVCARAVMHYLALTYIHFLNIIIIIKGLALFCGNGVRHDYHRNRENASFCIEMRRFVAVTSCFVAVFSCCCGGKKRVFDDAFPNDAFFARVMHRGFWRFSAVHRCLHGKNR